MGDDFDPDLLDLIEDDPCNKSSISVPLRAWKRRGRVLQEVATNPSSMRDQQLAMAAYQSRMAPWRAFWGILSGLVSAVVAKKVADVR